MCLPSAEPGGRSGRPPRKWKVVSAEKRTMYLSVAADNRVPKIPGAKKLGVHIRALG